MVLAVEKRLSSPLMEPSSVEKVMEIDEHIGCAMSGLTADARTLVEHARVTTQVCLSPDLLHPFLSSCRVSEMDVAAVLLPLQLLFFHSSFPWSCCCCDLPVNLVHAHVCVYADRCVCMCMYAC